MKLIIDINEEVRDWLVNGFPDEEDAVRLLDIVKNGTPIAEAYDCILREFALEPFEVFDDEEWTSSDIRKYLNSLPSVIPKQSFEGMTNGEVLKKLFPDININDNPLFQEIYTEIPFNDYVGVNIDCMREWWNALYKENK